MHDVPAVAKTAETLNFRTHGRYVLKGKTDTRCAYHSFQYSLSQRACHRQNKIQNRKSNPIVFDFENMSMAEGRQERQYQRFLPDPAIASSYPRFLLRLFSGNSEGLPHAGSRRQVADARSPPSPVDAAALSPCRCRSPKRPARTLSILRSLRFKGAGGEGNYARPPLSRRKIGKRPDAE